MSKRITRWLIGLTAAWACLAVGFGGYPEAAPQQATPSPAKAQATQYKAVLDKYCVSCHNDKLKTGGLTLDKLDLANVHEGGEQWEKVVRKLKVGMMPPLGAPRPDQATFDSMTAFLETSLDQAAAAAKEPGRPRGMHRLNRAEYANSIRDLLALEIDPNALLPPDDSSFGFDNIADVLGVSPVLQERYLSAANKIAALAVGDVAQLRQADEQTFVIPADVTQTQHQEGLPLGTRGGRLFHMVFPLDGEYQFRTKLFRTNLGNMRGMDFPSKFIVLIDGAQVFENVVGGPEDTAEIRKNTTLGENAIDDRLAFKIPVKAGPHDIGVTFVMKSQAERPTTLQPFLATLDHIDADGISKIDQLKVLGPFNITGPGDTPSRRKIFTCRPANTADESACARTILASLARRGYRRPVTDKDVQVLMNFYNTGRNEGNFDGGIALGLTYILSSPEFVFRVERDPANLAPGSVYRLSDTELAARLSFFLWSSIPDDQLLNTASQGRLKDPLVLAQEVKRMLANPKARSLTTNFAGQWLWLRNLNNVAPNYNDFPEFDRNLRESMRTETEMFFKSIVDENRSVVDLMNANYTFLNERLAKHYGISNVYGSQFRRVTLTDPNRFGLLGQGSFLTVTSNPDRTSPVHRGKWVLENLLGTPPPPPPPGVPPLKTAAGNTKPKTLREEMEAHRANPVCASCHKLMDPIGFALDNFDGIGQWRSAYPGTPSSPGSPIIATGQLADGSAIDGPVSLRQALMRKPDHFVETMTEKLLTYALGRGLEYYDMPAVRTIVKNAGKNDYRFQSLVMGIVTSTPFQMRMTPEKEPAASQAH